MTACLFLFVWASQCFSQGAAWPDLSQPLPAQGGGERDAAVIIGAENYAFVAKVPGASQNAHDWQAFMTDSLKVPFDKVALLRDNEATLEKMRKFAAKASAAVEPGGTLWFLFIGHGAPSKDGKDGLLVGTDAQQDPDGLYARSLSRGELLGILAKGGQARTVVLIDACFSGRSQSGEALVAGLQPLVLMRVPEGAVDPRAVILSAAKSDEFAGPLPRAERMRPAFSYLALGALRGWAADARGRVTASSLVDFARRALALEKGRTQTPELTAGDPKAVLAVGREHPPDLARIDRDGGPAPKNAVLDIQVSPLPAKTRKPKKGSGDAGIEWVRIPGGKFTMGSDDGAPDERPKHAVRIRTFFMARTLVTFGQYMKCVAAGACAKPDRDSPGDDYPVVGVDWEQARDFSEWVGGRLPSEAEWEYAARSGGRERKYPWGDEEAACGRAIINEGVINTGSDGCGKNSTWPVCSRPAGNTAQGLCDMAGNVFEWTQDWYHPSYVGAPADGSAWEAPTSPFRAGRAGSWHYGLTRITSRYHGDPRPRHSDMGFRPVK